MNETAPQQQILIGTVLGDSYRIERLVAVGGMGELYEATHLRLSGRYAVKVLLPQFATYQEVLHRFAREAEITSRLRHPNIVSVLDFNTTPDGRAFLAMEFLEGQDLAAEQAMCGPMPLARVLDIVAQVVSSLAAAHEQGVVHRDLKPANIFITRLAGDGREMVKVLDFGISKMREARTKLTKEHVIIGTPQYMAPEQAQGHGHAIDHRADQFALASIAYELLAGQAAFRAETIPAILYLVVHEAPAPLSGLRPDLPLAVERVLLRGLAKEPEDRFADITSFGEALQAAAQGKPPAEPRPTRAGRRRHGLAEPPTLRDDRRNTTFGASTAEVSEHRLPTIRLQRRRAPQTAGMLVGGAALVGAIFLATRQRAEPPAVVTAPATERMTTRPPERPPERVPAEAPTPAAPPPRVPVMPWPPPAETAPAAQAATATTTAPAPTTAEPTAAPLAVDNAPAGLRVTIDGERVPLPAGLPRRAGRYVLRFESPGRRAQTVQVDGMALRHDIRLEMPRVAARPRPETPEPEEYPRASEPSSPEPLPAPPEEPAPAKQEPPPAEKRTPLIDDL